MKCWWNRWFPRIAIAWSSCTLVFDVFLGVVGGWWNWGFAAVMAVLLVFQIRMVRGLRALRMENAVDDFDEPRPPCNVRVEHLDGTITPVELVYGGLRNSMHMWIPVTPVAGLDRGATLKADMIPANSAIAIDIPAE